MDSNLEYGLSSSLSSAQVAEDVLVATPLAGDLAAAGELMEAPRLSLLYRCWRRGLDVLFGWLGMTALVLMLPILALLIFLDSPGPIFYRQARMGYGRKPFNMLKLRTMRPDAERLGALWASKDDPRITRVGRWLRATHLDELPQALNILRGEMSFIGPRPECEENFSLLEKANPLYSRRLLIKPGLTGWSQVAYGYGNSSDEELIKLNYDLYYIEHQSIRLDIKILLKTVEEVLLCHGR